MDFPRLTVFLAVARQLSFRRAAGDLHLSPAMEKQALRQLTRFEKAASSPLELLSDRELEVFTLLGEGKGTSQIASQLKLSIKTIESHRAHIKEKLNLSSGTQLVQHAIQWRNSQTGGPSEAG